MKKENTETKKGRHLRLNLRNNPPIVIKGKRGNHIFKTLEDGVDIAANCDEHSPLINHKSKKIEGLFSYDRVLRRDNSYYLKVVYSGVSRQRARKVKIYRSTFSQQACLLLALSNTSDYQLSLTRAYSILDDPARCSRQISKTKTQTKFDALNSIVKNVRREVGFTPEELYISERYSVVGLKVIVKLLPELE